MAFDHPHILSAMGMMRDADDHLRDNPIITSPQLAHHLGELRRMHTGTSSSRISRRLGKGVGRQETNRTE